MVTVVGRVADALVVPRNPNGKILRAHLVQLLDPQFPHRLTRVVTREGRMVRA